MATESRQAKLSSSTLVFSEVDRKILDMMLSTKFPYNAEMINKLIIQGKNGNGRTPGHSFLLELHRAIKAVAGATESTLQAALRKVEELLNASDFELRPEVQDPAVMKSYAKNYEKVVRVSKIRMYQSHSNAAYARVNDLVLTVFHRLSKFLVNSADVNGNLTAPYALEFYQREEAQAIPSADGKSVTYSYKIVDLRTPYVFTRKDVAKIYSCLKVVSDFRTKAANVSNKSAVLRAVNRTRTNRIVVPQAISGLLTMLGLDTKYPVGSRVQETVLNTSLKTALRDRAKSTQGAVPIVDQLGALLGTTPDKEFVITPDYVPGVFFTEKVYAAPKVKQADGTHIVQYRDATHIKRDLVLNVAGRSNVGVNLQHICKYNRLPNALKKLKYPALTPSVIQSLCEEMSDEGRVASAMGNIIPLDTQNLALLREAVVAKLTMKTSTLVTPAQINSELRKLFIKSRAYVSSNGAMFLIPDAISGLLSLYNLNMAAEEETDGALERRQAALSAVLENVRL